MKKTMKGEKMAKRIMKRRKKRKEALYTKQHPEEKQEELKMSGGSVEGGKGEGGVRSEE